MVDRLVHAIELSLQGKDDIVHKNEPDETHKTNIGVSNLMQKTEIELAGITSMVVEESKEIELDGTTGMVVEESKDANKTEI